MRLGAVLSPVAEWDATLEAARHADALGFDAVGFWGHYHSGRPEWPYISGWSMYGAIAAVTSRIRLVPMVLNNLHHQVGVLAKESSLLAIGSGGRFELGIGAGDWPESYAAWGEPYPAAAERVDRLVENLRVLRQLWTGQQVTMQGTFVNLVDACSTPAPSAPPRVVVGVGHSVMTAQATLGLADEINAYATERTLTAVRDAAANAGRPVDVSLFVGWEWDKWPADPGAELEPWLERGVERIFVGLGSADMPRRLDQLASLLSLSEPSG